MQHYVARLRQTFQTMLQRGQRLPLWQRMTIIGSLVVLLVATFFGVPFGIGLLQSHPADVTTPNTGASVTLTTGHPAAGATPLPTKKGTGSTKAPTDVLPLHFTPTMLPFTIPLTPGKATQVTSTDGSITISIPANALSGTPSHAAETSIGQVQRTTVASTPAPAQLAVTQIVPASGSTNSGGVVSFGTYLLQLQDSTGHEVTTSGLHAPVALAYHLPTHLPYRPQHLYAVLNRGSLPASAQAAHLGAPDVQAATLDGAGTTVSASVTLGTVNTTAAPALSASTQAPLTTISAQATGSGSATVGWLTNAPDAYFGKADSVHADLQSGGLSTDVPIDLPAGPGGLTPPVHLAYTSASVNGAHGLQAAADWVGMGWSLDMGQITWSQANLGSCTGCTKNYQSSWSLSDPYGTSATLIPPNTAVTTYYDDTTNTPVNAPTVWHTANESHVKVISYTNPTVDVTHFPPAIYASQPPCFRVWLTNGIMEEFGCTFDSRQFFPGQATNYVSAWKLDLITDPSGNQIHINYQSDMVIAPGGTTQYPRDVVPASIQWDSPACHNAQTACTGASWQPQMQVTFNPGHQVATASGTTCGAPNPDGSRCDNPQPVGVVAAPLVESTFVLNSLAVQVSPTGNQGVWNMLRSYQFSYSQSTWQVNSYNPVSNLPEGDAGELLLTQVQEFGTDGATKYPPQIFTYKQYQQHFLNQFLKANVQQSTASLNRYHSSTDRFETTLQVSNAYQFDFPLGMIYTIAQPGTIPISSCQKGNDLFLATNTQSLCDGFTFLQVLGFVYDTSKPMPQNVQSVTLYRCHVTSTGDLFSSTDPGCEGQQNDLRLGYALATPALAALSQYLGPFGAHWDTTGAVANAFGQPFIYSTTFGLISPTNPFQPNWNEDDGCLKNGTDRILATQAGECTQTGIQRTRVEGYSPASPQGGYTLALYQCYWTGPGVHFSSLDPNCGGQQIDYLLTYITPIPTSVCGPLWNDTACYLWDQTNHSYLIGIDRGLGAHQSFGWTEAHNNTHNVPAGSGLSALDPTACNGTQRGTGSCAVADEGAWSQEVLASQTVTTQSATNAQLLNTTSLSYNLSTLSSVMCPDCQVGMYGGDENDADSLDFYNTQFKGFALVQETLQDGSTNLHHFVSTEGIGVFDAPLVNGQGKCQNRYQDGSGKQVACTTSAAWDLANAASGRETQSDSFDKYGKLLGRSVTAYQAICPPSGVGASPAVSWYGNWDGHLVAEMDPTNPATVCDVQVQQTTAYTVNGVTTAPTSSNVPTSSTTYSYDSYGRVTQSETIGNSGTATDVVKHTQYIWNDAVSTAGAVPTGTYLIDTVAGTDVTAHDGSGRTACVATSYDTQPWATGQQSGLTRGLATSSTQYATCGVATGSAWGTGTASTATSSYNANGDATSQKDADANAGLPGHLATTGTCLGFTACRGYDSTYGILPVSSTNVLNQMTSSAYATTAANGFGLWPASATDANGQTSGITYDALGRVTSTTAPGEGTGLSTGTLSYPLPWCPSTGAALVCAEVDTTQRLDAATTITSRIFYDGVGRAVEMRTPGPSGQDVVHYALYNDRGQRTFVSQGYFVTAYTGAAGVSAFSTPDVAQHGVVTAYDSLNRVISAIDLAGKTTTTSYTTICAPAGTSDTGCYSATTVTDALQHQNMIFADAFGRGTYAQTFSGTTGSYTLYRTVRTQYDLAGRAIESDYADGTHKATTTYDDLGRQTTFTDPDLGSYTLSYDPNGNLLSSADPRGAAGTVYQSYDGLNRPVAKSINSNGSSPLATLSYDSTANGNQGIGRTTGETFASGPNQSVTGSYASTYDARGRQTTWSMTLGSTTTPFSIGYNDANQATTLTYPDGDVVTTGYSAQDWLSGVTETQGGTTTTLLNSLVYSGVAGANQQPSQAAVGNGVYTWGLSYDANLRPQETKVTQVSSSTTLFDQARSFDAVGNVSSTNTTLPQGTDNQTFCYDAQNRLTWAGSTGTAPTGCTSPTTGTLTGQSAQYSQSYSYDVLNRLTSGPKGGGYTYGDANHLDALTSAPSYSASYDAAGSMITRSGQQLGYDALRRLITWQNQATNPTQTASYAYNGSGERVQQSVTSGGATTTTSYLGGYEEVSVTGGTTTTTKYYSAGLATVTNVNGTLSYLVHDTLGSVSASLTASGGLQSAQLFAPYGAVRYSTGTMPTTYGFTGQRSDPSGLMYYHARYYDPSVGQFASADVAQGPNRYGYVAGNPETQTDPTGQRLVCDDESATCNPHRGNSGAGAGAAAGGTVGATVGKQGGGGTAERRFDTPCGVLGFVCTPTPTPKPTPTPTPVVPPTPTCPAPSVAGCSGGSGNGLLSKVVGGASMFIGVGLAGLVYLQDKLQDLQQLIDPMYNGWNVQNIIAAILGTLASAGAGAAIGAGVTGVIGGWIGAIVGVLVGGEALSYLGLINAEKAAFDDEMSHMLYQISHKLYHEDPADTSTYVIREDNIGVTGYDIAAELIAIHINPGFILSWNSALPGFIQQGTLSFG